MHLNRKHKSLIYFKKTKGVIWCYVIWWGNIKEISQACIKLDYLIKPVRPERTIVILIHNKPRITLSFSRLVVDENDLMWRGGGIKENCHVLVKQFYVNIHSKPLVVGKLSFRDEK